MIVSSGYNIAGPEVEAALLSHPAVAECGVVAAPDEARGMIVKAYVVAASGMSRLTLRLRQRCRITSSATSRLTNIRARSNSSTQLPKTGTGKLQRFALRQMRRRARGSTQPASQRNE